MSITYALLLFALGFSIVGYIILLNYERSEKKK
jgi:hypothetical protein